MVKSIYIHIPFCKHICSYCDFCKMFYNNKMAEKYIKELINDIENIPKNKYKTIYIGGGTPSSLDIKLLEKLLMEIDKLPKENDYEYTFECNIEDVTDELLITLSKHLVNRISIGIETFNKELLKEINRDYSINIKEKINLAKKYFDNINVDLMYAITNETINDLKNDLTDILSLNVPHISCYSLILEPNTVMYNKHVKYINEDLDFEMYKLLETTLEENGYVHYEVSNYTKKGFASKHNLTYWHNEEYYGLGLGASGFVNGIRYDNTKSINHYLEGKKILTKEIMTKDTMMDNEMILGLRTLTGVNKKTFQNKYNTSINKIYDIIELEKNKLLEENETYIRIPKDKIYISNQILVHFLRGE